MSTDTSISALRRAAQAAKTPEQRAAALELVLGAAGRGAPDEGEIWSLAGRLHRDGGDTDKALDAFAKGEAADSGKAGGKAPLWTNAEHAKLLLKAGRPEEAVAAARRGLDSGRSSPALLAALAQALLALRTPMAQTEPALREAILANPGDRLLVENGFDRLREGGTPQTALAWLEAMQDESPTLLRGVLAVLAGLNGREAVRTRFAAKLERLAGEEPYAPCARLWQAVIEDRSPDAADRAIVGRDAQKAEMFFQFFRPEPEQAPLFGGDAEAEARLRAFGVQVEPLRSFAAELTRVSNPVWRAILDEATIEGESARTFMRKSEDESAVTERIVATGTLAMMDPFTGENVAPFDSCVMFGRTAYAYRGRELFYLICGRGWHAALGLYVPRYNLSINFEERRSSLLGENMANLLAMLLIRFARHNPALPTPRPGDGPRRLVLSVPATENFAHHIWNFYSAIERLIRTDRLQHVSKTLFSGTEFFGPLDELFPELAAAGVERPQKNNVIDPCPFDPDGLVLSAGGFFVARSLTQRIIDTMARRPRISQDIPEPADYPQASRIPVFWFGLRLRDKAWVGQEAGVTQIIRILANKHPDALFLLDGFSYPVGIDLITDQWADVATGLAAMGERVRAASGVPSRVVNMVGNTMRESVLWAQVTDAYLAPYGTTQHKVGWFSKAAGLVYMPATTVTPENAARSPACSVVEYSPPPDFVFAQAASPGERRGGNRSRERFVNVSLEAEPLAERLDAMIAGRG